MISPIFLVTIFFVGLAEMLIVTAWTKAVSNTKVWESGIISWINVIIWYYVLQAIINNVNNWSIAVVYAFGCAAGTMLTTYFFSRREAKAAK